MFWEDIFDDWIMPYLAKKINKAHILSHEFTSDELREIDKNFAIHTANSQMIEKVLAGELVSQDDYDQWMQQAGETVGKTKATRFLEIPKDYYKDLDSKVTVNISGENKDKQQTIDNLIAIMNMYAKNPALATNPVLTKLFLEIVEQSNIGISPVSLMSAIADQAKQAQDAQKQQMKVGESMNFKDLPPEGQVQMANQAGIKLNQPQAQPQPAWPLKNLPMTNN